MPSAGRAPSRVDGEQHGPSAFRGFRRARSSLWILCGILTLWGAALHDWAIHSVAVRLLWLVTVAASIGVPLRYLLGFRCPRCHGVYLATGGWRDFFGLGRILWAKQCGGCSLPLPEEEGPPSSGGLTQSRPV